MKEKFSTCTMNHPWADGVPTGTDLSLPYAGACGKLDDGAVRKRGQGSGLVSGFDMIESSLAHLIIREKNGESSRAMQFMV